MKHFFLLLSVIVFSTITSAAQDTKVLFVGNSLTFWSNMPNTFEDICNDLGNPTEVSVHAPGGTGLVDHVSNPELYNLFRQGGWDYVVIQPGTGESGGPQYGGTPIDTSLGRIHQLLDSIYRYSPCAQVMFYEISNGVTGDEQANIDQYNASMEVIRNNISTFAGETNLSMAPVGEAFKSSWNNNPSLMLWGSFYDVHPNSKGAYLIACVFYASIFQKNSFGSSVVTSYLNLEEAQYFQQLADSVVLTDKSVWGLDKIHITNFRFEQNSDSEYQFVNFSQSYDSLKWDFGDGSISYEENPVHIFDASAGIYDVVLNTWKEGCLISKTMEAVVTSIPPVEKSEPLTVYPIPCENTLFIKGKQAKSYAVYTPTGQLIMRGKGKHIEVSTLKKGVYHLWLSDDKQTYRTSFVKE